MLTNEELQAITQRQERTTKGLWYWDSYSKIFSTSPSEHLNIADNDEPCVALIAQIHNPSCKGDDTFHPEERANAEFLAKSHQDIPALLSHITEQQQAIETLREALAWYADERNWGMEEAPSMLGDKYLLIAEEGLSGEDYLHGFEVATKALTETAAFAGEGIGCQD